MKYIVHTDGGARGNPGPAAIGVVIEAESSVLLNAEDRKLMAEIGKRIGETTNNVAEYTAVIEALKSINESLRQSVSEEKPVVEFYLDSLLVVNQMNGLFKIKEPTLKGLWMKAKELEREVGGVVTYAYVPREKNKEADAMVNKALDEPR